MLAFCPCVLLVPQLLVGLAKLGGYVACLCQDFTPYQLRLLGLPCVLCVLCPQVSWSPGLSEVLQQVEARFEPFKSSGCGKEDFIKIVRAQVRHHQAASGWAAMADSQAACTASHPVGF